MPQIATIFDDIGEDEYKQKPSSVNTPASVFDDIKPEEYGMKIEPEKPSLASRIIGNPEAAAQDWQRRGQLIAKSANEATAGFMGRLDLLTTKLSAGLKKAGAPEWMWQKGGLFEKAKDTYLKNAEYWNQRAGKAGLTDELIGEIIGGSVPGMFEFALGPVYSGAVGTAEGGWKKGAEKALERAALGKILEGVNSLKVLPRTTIGGIVGGIQAAAEGGGPREIAKGAASLGLYSAMAGGGPKQGLREAMRSQELTPPKITTEGMEEPGAPPTPNVSRETLLEALKSGRLTPEHLADVKAEYPELADTVNGALDDFANVRQAAQSSGEAPRLTPPTIAALPPGQGFELKGKPYEGQDRATAARAHNQQIMDSTEFAVQNELEANQQARQELARQAEQRKEQANAEATGTSTEKGGPAPAPPGEVANEARGNAGRGGQQVRVGEPQHEEMAGGTSKIEQRSRPAEETGTTQAGPPISGGRPNNESIASDFNTSNPGHAMKFDGEYDRSGINKPTLYQFTPQEGPLKGRTLSVEKPSVEAIQAKMDEMAKQSKTIKKTRKKKSPGPLTLRGRIKQAGNINFLNFKGELKNMPLEVKFISNAKTGTPIDLIERTLKDEGWLGPNEDLLEVLTQGKKVLKRGKLFGTGSEEMTSDQKAEASRQQQEWEYEPEEPPPGNYVEMKAEDLPEGNTVTIVDGNGMDGWDEYKIVSKDPFGIKLEDGRKFELGPLDRVMVRSEDIQAKNAEDGRKPSESDLADKLIEKGLMRPQDKGKKQYTYTIRKIIPNNKFLTFSQIRDRAWKPGPDFGRTLSRYLNSWHEAGILDAVYNKMGEPLYAWPGTEHPSESIEWKDADKYFKEQEKIDYPKTKQTEITVEEPLLSMEQGTPEAKPTKREKSISDQGQNQLFGYNQTDMFGRRTINDLKNSLKNEKGSSELVNDIVSHGTDLIRKGIKSFEDFTARMKERFSNVWDKIKDHMSNLWSVVSNQRGQIGSGEPKTRRQRVDEILAEISSPKAKEPTRQAEETALTEAQQTKDGNQLANWITDLAVPGFEKVIEPFKQASQGMKSLVLPTAKSPEHLDAAEVLGQSLGEMSRSSEQADKALRMPSRMFDKMSVHILPTDASNPGLKFMSDISAGRKMSPEFQKVANLIDQLFKHRIGRLEQVEAPLSSVRENYFPGMWTKESIRAFNRAMQEAFAEGKGSPESDVNSWTAEQKAWVRDRTEQYLKQKAGNDRSELSYLAKRPFKGKESFRKQKVFEDIQTGIDFGLKPISNNPIDLVKLKLSEMDRSIMANRAIKEWKERGLIRFLKSGKDMPNGWSKIDDRYGTVYGPPEIMTSEYVSQNIYDALQQTAKNLGVSTERKANAGRDRLGYAVGGKKVVTQANTEMSVLGHEVGHALDAKYNLWDRIVKRAEGIGRRGEVTKSATQKARAEIQNELRQIADLRWEGQQPSDYFKKYTRKKSEKIAQMLELYTAAPDRMMDIAPHVHDALVKFLNDIPELKPIKDMVGGISYKEISTKRVLSGFPVIGQWIAKQPVADVLNNYLSSSMYNSKYFGVPFRSYMYTANTLNQMQLGVGSMFHLGFTTADVTTSQAAEAVKDLYGVAKGNRNMADLAKSTGRIFTAFIQNPIEGNRIIKEWLSPSMEIDSKAPISSLPKNNAAKIAMIAKAAELSGGGFKIERGLRTDTIDSFVRNMHSGFKGKLKVVLESPTLFTEALAKPLMDGIVPRQKAGIFGELAGRIIEMNPEKSLEQLRSEFRQAWNRVDARMGQVRYNRLFINNAAKNVIQALVRAPGWTGGTIAEIGGALKDTGKFLNEWIKSGKAPDNIPDRVAYTLALFTTVGLVNGILTSAFTGDSPDKLQPMDFWAFRTGTFDEHGRPERMVLPTYMKDVWAYYKSPGQTLLHKTNPILSLAGDILQNRDYYGVRVYNPEDDFLQRQFEKGKFALKQYKPFWIRGVEKESERAGGLGRAIMERPSRILLPEIGIMPAPSRYVQSEFEQYATRLIQNSDIRIRTQEQFEKGKLKQQLLMGLRRGDKDAKRKIFTAYHDHKITGRDAKNLISMSKTPPVVNVAKRMSIADLSYGLQFADSKEKKLIYPVFAEKFKNVFDKGNLDPEEIKKYRQQLKMLSNR